MELRSIEPGLWGTRFAVWAPHARAVLRLPWRFVETAHFDAFCACSLVNPESSEVPSCTPLSNLVHPVSLLFFT